MKKQNKGVKIKTPLFFILKIFILYIIDNILWESITTDTVK